MKSLKKVLLFVLAAAVLLACLAGCGAQGEEKPDASEKPGSSAAAGKEDEGTPENGGEPARPQTLDFSRLDGVGNNLLNLTAANSKFTHGGAFAADDTCIYFSDGNYKGLWRMKLDGSECESYIPELDSDAENFNLLDGELYYSIDCYIRAIDLATKEERDLGYYGDDVSKLLVIGERVYFTSDGKSTGIKLWSMPRDGSEEAACLYQTTENIGGISELVTDGERLYYFIASGQGTDATLNVYELDLETAGAELEKRASARAPGNDVFLPVNGIYFTFGANGFLMAKMYYEGEDKIWKYEAMFYADMDGNLRGVETTDLGRFGEAKADGSFYWTDMGMRKFVLGNNLFGVGRVLSENQENADDLRGVYVMQDMDVSSPSLVYTYSDDDFVAGGVCGDKLYIIEQDGDAMKLTTIDENGNIG